MNLCSRTPFGVLDSYRTKPRTGSLSLAHSGLISGVDDRSPAMWRNLITTFLNLINAYFLQF